jgi:hypothetical protein
MPVNLDGQSDTGTVTNRNGFTPDLDPAALVRDANTESCEQALDREPSIPGPALAPTILQVGTKDDNGIIKHKASHPGHSQAQDNDVAMSSERISMCTRVSCLTI